MASVTTPKLEFGKRILVVDDEEGMRHMLGVVLAKNGFVVSEAANGLEALERLKASGWFVYRFLDGTVRFMCSWATTPEMVDELAEALAHVR